MSVNFNSVKNGDVLTFNYKGEKDVYSRKRLVKAVKVDGDLLGGYDLLDGDRYKNFHLNNSTSAKVLGNNVVVKSIKDAVDAFGKASINAQLGGLQEVVKETVPDAESVVLDRELNVFLVSTKIKSNQSSFEVSMEVDKDNKPVKVVICWRNKEGKTYDFDFTPAQNGVLDEEKFVVGLAEHFGYTCKKK